MRICTACGARVSSGICECGNDKQNTQLIRDTVAYTYGKKEDAEQKELILNVVDDTVSNFLYYDRKDNETLPVGVIEKHIQKGNVSVQEITDKFKECLIKYIKE